MMADSIEAASRSLKEYTEESIAALVEKIIDSQVAEGFFKECPITFSDIAHVKELFKEKLKIMYHTRISYQIEMSACCGVFHARSYCCWCCSSDDH